MSQLYEKPVLYPSMISFIAGPSRTGDIERSLVLVAHGPEKLAIFCAR
jgi:L-lactate dehydrogenase complex protein LldG